MDLSWWDLECIIRWSNFDSAIMRQQHPDTWWKSPQVQVTALVYDGIQEGNWQRSGNQEAPYPEPLLAAPSKKPQQPAKPQLSPRDIRDELARRRQAA